MTKYYPEREQSGQQGDRTTRYATMDAPRRTAGRGTHLGPRAIGGPRELRADACLQATCCLTLLGRGAVSGLKAELDIGADKRTSA